MPGIQWNRPGIRPRQTRGLWNFRKMPSGFDPRTGKRAPWHDDWPEDVSRRRKPVGGPAPKANFASNAPAYDVDDFGGREPGGLMASAPVQVPSFAPMGGEEFDPYDVMHPELESNFGGFADV